MKLKQIKWFNKYNNNINIIASNLEYRKKHSEFIIFNMPKSFYFKIYYDRCSFVWAIIKNDNNKYIIYFIDENGRAFDKLEYKNKKVAQRLLRKNKFISSNNQKCPLLPIQPIYINLHKFGRYSNGKYWIPQDRFKKINPVSEKTIPTPHKNLFGFFDKFLLLIIYLSLLLLFLCAIYYDLFVSF